MPKRYYYHFDKKPDLNDIVTVGDYQYWVVSTDPLKGTDSMYTIEETKYTYIRKFYHHNPSSPYCIKRCGKS
jgi:hypothetical protein